jgi:hypothetical protein
MSFASKYISEIEGGKGLIGGAKEAGRGTVKDIKQKFSKDNIVRSIFGGEDIFSAAIRSKLGVKKEKKGKASPEGTGDQGLSSEGITFLKILAKNSMSLPGVARDMNVMRQNIQKLVKLEAGPQKKGKKAYATGADTFFLREDERERALEAQKGKVEGKPTAQAPGAGKDKEGGFLDSIMGFFSGGFMSAIKTLFSPKTLMKVFSKVFLPIAIIGTLFSGIMDGFKKYQETGNLGDAIVAGLGGMLNFLTFGLFGEDTLKTLFDSINDFFKPITDTISNIFTGIKDFVKGLFGGKVDVKDDAPVKSNDVKPTMPDPKQFALDAAKASGASDKKSEDLGGLFGAVGKGDSQGLFSKAQEFASKYPEQPASATSPFPMTKEGNPLDQAQRKIGEASKALGIPLESIAPPTPATPPAPVTTAPTPAPEMSNSDKIKQLESYIESNKARFAKREDDVAKHIASIKNDPSRAKQLEGEYKQTLDVERKEMENANDGFQRQISSIQKSSTGSVASASGASPSVDSGGGSSGAAATTPSSGGGGAGGAEAMASDATSPSGSDMSQASSEISEGQRMESAADIGSTINSPSTTNQMSSQDNNKPQPADVYNSDFAKMLATT